MKELGQLEAHHQEFDKKNVQVVVVSLEDQEGSKAIQTDFPHLLVVSDAKRQLTDAIAARHPHSALDGGDTAAPTTVLLDGSGTIRWTFRPGRVFDRLSPEQLLAAIDENLSAR